MKACKITFSLQLLLELIGLKDAELLEVYGAIASEQRNEVTLYLTGDHPDLPDGKIGDEVPRAIILCEKIQSHIEVIK